MNIIKKALLFVIICCFVTNEAANPFVQRPLEPEQQNKITHVIQAIDEIEVTARSVTQLRAHRMRQALAQGVLRVQVYDPAQDPTIQELINDFIHQLVAMKPFIALYLQEGDADIIEGLISYVDEIIQNLRNLINQL